MINLLTTLFALHAILILVLMLRDAFQGKTYLVSIRNVFLLGFIIFQVTSPIYPLRTGLNDQFDLINPTRSGAEVFFLGALFFGVFYLAYPRLPLVKKFVNLLPIAHFEPNVSLNLAIAVTLSLIAVVLHFGVNVPYVGVLAIYLAVSYSAIACGLVGWVWAPRLFNPVYALIAGGVVLVNGLNVITGSFGRRELVAVLGCFLWGMFYSWWRHYDPKKAVVYIALIGAIPVTLLALYTSARSSSDHDRSAMEHVQAIVQDGSVSTGFMLLLSGQNSAGVSMWCVENFPEVYPTRPLHTMRYAIMFPIPRAIWPNKPMPLSKELPYMAQMTKVHRDRLSIGPGIIGHAAAEGGLYALIIYAIILAYICRILDDLQLRCIENPLIVLSMGSALGQVLGIARGESGVFIFVLLFSVVLAYTSLVFVSKFLVLMGFGPRHDETHENEYAQYDSAYYADQDSEYEESTTST